MSASRHPSCRRRCRITRESWAPLLGGFTWPAVPKLSLLDLRSSCTLEDSCHRMLTADRYRMCPRKPGPFTPMRLPKLEHTASSAFPACLGNQCLLRVTAFYPKAGGSGAAICNWSCSDLVLVPSSPWLSLQASRQPVPTSDLQVRHRRTHWPSFQAASWCRLPSMSRMRSI